MWEGALLLIIHGSSAPVTAAALHQSCHCLWLCELTHYWAINYLTWCTDEAIVPPVHYRDQPATLTGKYLSVYSQSTRLHIHSHLLHLHANRCWRNLDHNETQPDRAPFLLAHYFINAATRPLKSWLESWKGGHYWVSQSQQWGCAQVSWPAVSAHVQHVACSESSHSHNNGLWQHFKLLSWIVS